MRISVNAEKCTGCRICELVCSQLKLQAFNPKSACIKVVNLDYWGFSSPVICIQCRKPVCVEVCPKQALNQTEIGTILVDKEKLNFSFPSGETASQSNPSQVTIKALASFNIKKSNGFRLPMSGSLK